MLPNFGLWNALCGLATRPTAQDAPEVCPNAVPPNDACPTPDPVNPALSPAEWAKSLLDFDADPKQIEVLNHQAHRLILCCSRQWGKSTVIAIKAFHYALHNPGSEILVTSDTEAHAGIIVAKMANYAAVLGVPAARVLGKRFSLRLPNQSRIFAVPATERAVVGYTADIIIVDEAAIAPDEVISYLSRTLTQTNGAFWLLSTPRGQLGVFYHIWHTEPSRWHKVKATVDDCPYISPEFLEEQKLLFPDIFRQEFYCEFVQPAGRLLSRERFAKNVDPALNCRIIPDED